MSSIFDLTGSTVLVTGATGYLGRAMCLGLAGSGAKVLVNSRCKERARTLVFEIKADGGSAEAAVFDVTNIVSLKEYFDNYTGSLNVIVNNAYAGTGGTIKSSKQEQYGAAYDVVVTASHNLLQFALPYLRASVANRQHASVINIASMYGCVSPEHKMYDSNEGTNPPFYGAAKAALIQWTKYAACEFGHEGIKFNAISPGPFPDKSKNLQLFIDKLESKVPLGRVGNSDEIIGPVVFLASSSSSYITGINLVVDGGWTAW